MKTYNIDMATGVIYYTGKIHASHPRLQAHLKEDMRIRADSVDAVRDAIRTVLTSCGITDVEDSGYQISPTNNGTGDYVYASYNSQPTIMFGNYEVSMAMNGSHLFVNNDSVRLQIEPDGTVYVYHAKEINHPSRIPTDTPTIGFTVMTVK